MIVTIEDILNIGNCDPFFFDHYREDHPVSNHLYWGELSPLEKIKKETVEDRLNNPEWKNNDLYLLCRYLQYGDYDDSCMVERSNRKLFLEDYGELPGVYTISGGYGSEGIALSFKWLLDPVNEEKATEIIEILNGLNNYPCINDEDMSNMEYDAFYEALKDYGVDDTVRALSKKYGIDVHDYDRSKIEALIIEIDGNGNPVFEIEPGGICYIDIDDMIVPKITRDQFISALTDYEVIE